MARWKDDGEGTVFLSPGKKLVLQSRSIAGHFVDAHNADIAALEAERDELRRRLEEVVATLRPSQNPECWDVVRPLYARAVAIAEGRTE